MPLREAKHDKAVRRQALVVQQALQQVALVRHPPVSADLPRRQLRRMPGNQCTDVHLRQTVQSCGLRGPCMVVRKALRQNFWLRQPQLRGDLLPWRLRRLSARAEEDVPVRENAGARQLAVHLGSPAMPQHVRQKARRLRPQLPREVPPWRMPAVSARRRKAVQVREILERNVVPEAVHLRQEVPNPEGLRQARLQKEVLHRRRRLRTLQRSVQPKAEVREPQMPGAVPLGALLPLPADQTGFLRVRGDDKERAVRERADGTAA